MKPDLSAHNIAVLIPCYNEAATIAKVVSDFRMQLPSAKIYVFNNNSSDDSAALAAKAGAIVINEKRQGKGFVVSAMLLKVQADFYVMVDGDDTYPAESVHELLSPLIEDKADMTVGLRLADYEQEAFRAFHVFGNKAICRLMNTIFNTHLKDPLSGYRAFTREVARQLPVVAIGFDIETELTLQMLYRHLVIQEIPIRYRARPDGSPSKLNTMRDGIVIFLKIFSILRSYKPLTFFGSLAILSELAAALSGLFVLKSLGQGTSVSLALAIAASSFFIIGIFLVSLGLIINSLNFRLLENMSVIEKQIHWMHEKPDGKK